VVISTTRESEGIAGRPTAWGNLDPGRYAVGYRAYAEFVPKGANRVFLAVLVEFRLHEALRRPNAKVGVVRDLKGALPGRL